MVHGDYHPANQLIDPTSEEVKITSLDWDMVGLGSGPQEVGQYVISHMEPHIRRSCEKELLDAYYAQLVLGGVSAESYTRD